MKGTEETIKDYQERINKVLMYVDEHLDEKMELDLKPKIKLVKEKKVIYVQSLCKYEESAGKA